MRRKCKPFEFYINEDGCFICTSHAMDLDGYPLVKRNQKMNRVSRYIYEECFGPISEGFVIRHKCDNRHCINPEHLEEGTHKQNSLDMVKRNRQAKGSKNGSAKLTESDVKEIRHLKEKGLRLTDLSNKFGVSVTNVCDIVNKRSWKHV